MQLTATNICKTFGATTALKDVSAVFRSGEIRAVIGENGAGKSTLFKVISSVHERDSGVVDLDGVEFHPTDHIAAAKQGVAYVFQESTINPYISVAENIFLDRLRSFTNPLGIINRKLLEKSAQEILDDMGAHIHVRSSLWDLDFGQWKIIEIARALTYNPQVIFFDESTAYLNNREVAAFLGVVHSLKEKGLAIGFVSHHMNEIFQIADVATIMKDGQWVADKVVGDVTLEEIQLLMVGRNIDNIYPEKKTTMPTEPVVAAENVSCESGLHDVSFTLKKGEILGIGGLKGSGGEEILGALLGDIPMSSGSLSLYGEPYRPKTPHDALKNKLTMLPGERTVEGLIVDFSIKDNINMGNLPRVFNGLFVDAGKETSIAKGMIQKVLIKASSCESPCSSLSGGNMQKVVLAKCLATHPDIILLNNPTRGIDVGARLEIYKLIRSLSEQGITFLLLSEDLSELIGLCDRAIIMRRGEISKQYDFGDTMTEEDVIGYML